MLTHGHLNICSLHQKVSVAHLLPFLYFHADLHPYWRNYPKLDGAQNSKILPFFSTLSWGATASLLTTVNLFFFYVKSRLPLHAKDFELSNEAMQLFTLLSYLIFACKQLLTQKTFSLFLVKHLDSSTLRSTVELSYNFVPVEIVQSWRLSTSLHQPISHTKTSIHIPI